MSPPFKPDQTSPHRRNGQAHGAGHVDLYDRVHLIPWGKLAAFFGKHLAQTVAA